VTGLCRWTVGPGVPVDVDGVQDRWCRDRFWSALKECLPGRDHLNFLIEIQRSYSVINFGYFLSLGQNITGWTDCCSKLIQHNEQYFAPINL
jgi:hypothetical protein